MRVTDYLNKKRVHFEMHEHRPTFTAQQMAAVEHVPGMRVAKPVVVQVDGHYYMCVVPACCKVDLNILRRELGAGEVQLAAESDMESLFPDCELGAEPPLGNVFGMATLLDRSLNDQDYIVFQAGRHDESVKLKLSDYKALVEPRVLSFSYHLH